MSDKPESTPPPSDQPGDRDPSTEERLSVDTSASEPQPGDAGPSDQPEGERPAEEQPGMAGATYQGEYVPADPPESSETSHPASEASAPPPPPPSRDRGILDYIVPIGASVVITLILVIILAILLGYAGAPGEVAVLREQNNVLQTQVADLESLSDALGETEELVATIQAEVGTNQGLLATFATTQAGQAEDIDTLAERTDRVNGFLELLSEIAREAVEDMTPTAETPEATPTAVVTPTIEPTSTSVPTPTIEPTSTSVPTPEE